MTVEQFVLLCNYSQLNQNEGNYKALEPIFHIVCTDGHEISVQVHAYVHAAFEGIQPKSGMYNSRIGRKIVFAETDDLDLDQFGFDSIEDIESFVQSHGGIDLEKTLDKAFERVKK